MADMVSANKSTVGASVSGDVSQAAREAALERIMASLGASAEPSSTGVAEAEGAYTPAEMDALDTFAAEQAARERAVSASARREAWRRLIEEGFDNARGRPLTEREQRAIDDRAIRNLSGYGGAAMF